MRTTLTKTQHRSTTAIGVALALGTACVAVAARAAPPQGIAFTVEHTVPVPNRTIQGIRLRELSGLAWDADERLLYAVSDRGHIFHFELQLGAARIERLEPVLAATLRDPRDAGRKFNAEGLALRNADNGIKGDTQLVVALENGPAVVRFTPRGEALADVDLPPALSDAGRYRSKNKRLESIAVHPQHGVVLAPEAPLKGEPKTRHTLYATSGGSWSFEALQSGSDIKAIETLAGGGLLVLERIVAGAGSGERRAALRRIDPASCGESRVCATAGAPPGMAGHATGNYEGMARLSDTLVLLVSDDGAEPTGVATFALIRLHAR